MLRRKEKREERMFAFFFVKMYEIFSFFIKIDKKTICNEKIKFLDKSREYLVEALAFTIDLI